MISEIEKFLISNNKRLKPYKIWKSDTTAQKWKLSPKKQHLLKMMYLPSSSDGEGDLRLSWDEEIASGLGLSEVVNKSLLLSLVLIVVFFSIGSNLLSLVSSLLSLFISSLLELLQ